jgi:hypothetical protein
MQRAEDRWHVVRRGQVACSAQRTGGMRYAEDRWHACSAQRTGGIQNTKGMTHALRAYDLACGTPYEYNTCDTCSLGTNFRGWGTLGYSLVLTSGAGVLWAARLARDRVRHAPQRLDRRPGAYNALTHAHHTHACMHPHTHARTHTHTHTHTHTNTSTHTRVHTGRLGALACRHAFERRCVRARRGAQRGRYRGGVRATVRGLLHLSECMARGHQQRREKHVLHRQR